MDIEFEKDLTLKGCSCEENPDQENFIYLCRKCGGGYTLEGDKWNRVLRFNEEAMQKIFLILNS